MKSGNIFGLAGWWIGVAALRLLLHLPYRWQLALGALLGDRLRLLARDRRRIAAINFALCFPQHSAAQQQTLLRAHFRALGMGIIETALAWWGTDAQLRTLHTIEGLEHLDRALAQGRGVLLLSAHFTALELGGRLLSLHRPIHVVYREHKNPLLDERIRRARLRNLAATVNRRDIRAMLRSLKAGLPLWYAPDQNYGRAHSVFRPFFGIPAAMITTPARLARLSGAPVVPFFPMRLPGGRGYRLMLLPVLENYPGGDVATDAERINACIEQAIRMAPEQYLWVHRRFKTRPRPEDPKFY